MPANSSSASLVFGAVFVVVVVGGVGAWRVLDQRAADTAMATEYDRATVRDPAPFGDTKLANQQRVQAINRMNEGIQSFDRGDVEAAESALKDAVRIDPTYAAAHHTLGQIYKKQNKLLDAELAFLAAISAMNPEPNGEYHYDLGAVQTAQAEADGLPAGERAAGMRAAIASFQAALKLDPQLYKAHYRIGTLHEKLDEPRLADAAYRACIQQKPSYSPAFVSLGNMYIDHGEPDAAMAMLKRGVELNGTDARMWTGLGRAHFELGQMQDAVTAYTKARAIDPDGVDALYGLGMSYAELRMRKEAKESLEAFLAKAGPETRADLKRAANDTIMRIMASI
jgi:tetratricopeptide (TPR) repeat protein